MIVRSTNMPIYAGGLGRRRLLTWIHIKMFHQDTDI
jgi:hypothetical protein